MIFQTLAALRVSDSVNPPGLPGLADPSPPPRSLPDTFSLEGHLFFLDSYPAFSHATWTTLDCFLFSSRHVSSP